MKIKYLIPGLILALIFVTADHYIRQDSNQSNETAEEEIVEIVKNPTAEDGSLPGDDIPATEYASLQLAPWLEEKEVSSHFATFVVTHYCGCSICCGKWSSGSESDATGALGTKLTPMRSISVDNKIIPLGTILTDKNGNKYKAEDTGSAIKGHKIDLFVGNHNKALELGVKELKLEW